MTNFSEAVTDAESAAGIPERQFPGSLAIMAAACYTFKFFISLFHDRESDG